MTALFLKYRPQTFSDLVGQDAVKKTLKNALNTERPAHAYLFAGSRGTGKTSTARIFAKGLNCTDLQQGDPCGKCKFCIDTMNGNCIDVIEIDAASNRGIDEIRDLREKITFMPNVAKRKVYIIDEVHMLTKEAFNALLKTLEEPPDHAYFCLATTEVHKIPETITSRCQTFLFERFTLDALVDRLAYIAKAENITTEKSALKLIAQKAEGGMRDAISLLEQISAETSQNITEDHVRESLGLSSTEWLNQFYTALIEGNTADGLNLLKNISKTGGDFRTFGHDFLAFLREKMFENVQNNKVLAQILPIINEIEKALARLKTSPIVELPLEIAVINLTSSIQSSVSTSEKKQNSKTVGIDTEKKLKKEEIKAELTVNTSKEDEKKESKSIIDNEKRGVEVKLAKTEPLQKISAQAITQKMEVIVQRSGIPIFAKKSFLTTIPEVHDGKIIFYTDSEFHRDKLSSTEVSLKIKSALNELFGGVSSVEFLKKGGSVKPLRKESKEVATPDDFLQF